MRNYLADYDQVAVSANLKETALNTEQTLDTALLVEKATVIQLDPRREDNRDELTGKEEADTIYDLGFLTAASLNFGKAQSQHFAFGLAYALGAVVTTVSGTGYKHVITPTSSMLLPSFTAAQRFGLTIFKRRFASLHVDVLKATFEKDSWAKLSLECKGTGKYTDSMTKETVTAAYNVASLTLAANAVQGSTAATRLDNVHSVRVLSPSTGQWVDVTVSVVSADTPAVLTITPAAGAAIEGISKAAAAVVTWTGHGLVNGDEITLAGITQAEWSALNATHVVTKIGDDTFSIPVDTSAFAEVYAPSTDPGTIVNATDADFEIVYTPTESAWCTLPARVTEGRPLRVTDCVLKMGGKWNGTTYLGGHTISDEVESIEYTLNNNLIIEYRIGGTGSYANYAIRQGRLQTLTLNRQMRDFLLQQRMADNEYFTVWIKATGDEYATGEDCSVELLFPSCGLLKAPISVNGKILAEAGDLIVMDDDTYGSVRAEVINNVATYAA